MALGRQIGGIGEIEVAASRTAGADTGDGTTGEPPIPPPGPPGRPSRPARTAVRWWIVLCAVLALGLTAAIAFRWGSRAGTPAGSGDATGTSSPTATSSTGPLSPAQIYSTVIPSLVFITVNGVPADSTVTSAADDSDDSGGDDSGVAIGTGLVVSAAGQVLTANHVVRGATSIHLTFADGTTSDATVAAADPETDTAMLTPDTLPSPVVPAVVGSADRLAVGDPVVAIGNPLGLAASTSSGVVSGLGRTAPGDGGVTLTGLIQFDAAVNPGNSGGPLLDSDGRAVGVVVELLNASGDDSFAGIGLAVPIGAALAGGGGPAPQK